MANWDILHVKSLEVEHNVPEAKLLEDIKEGRLSRDDCVRKPGEDRWWRIYEVREFRASADDAPVLEEPVQLEEGSLRKILADAEPTQEVARPRPRVVPPIPVAAPVAAEAFSMGETAIGAVVEEPEEGLPYKKKKHEEPEELDMTPMVDVAMQLILFFMVTSSMIMQMVLSFPKPAAEESTREKPKTPPPPLDELKADNGIYVDEEKQPTKETDLVAKFEKIKHDRPINGIIIMADEAAIYETVVKVVDAANMAKVDPIKFANPAKQAKKATKKKAIK